MKPITVLVHGLWYGPVSMRLLALRLERRGHPCQLFSYPTLGEVIDANARALHDYASMIDAPRLDFVGHSLGGLVILRMLAEFEDLPPGRAVLLGSPVQGSAVVSRLIKIRPARPFIGAASGALEASRYSVPRHHEIGIIAGTRSVGIGRLVDSLDQPNDGTIAAAETELPGASDSLELPVSHTGLVLSADVADATAAFLDSGRFESD